MFFLPAIEVDAFLDYGINNFPENTSVTDKVIAMGQVNLATKISMQPEIPYIPHNINME